MSNTFKIGLGAAGALVFAAALGLFLSQPSELARPPALSPSPGAAPTLAPTPPPTPEPTPEAATPVEIAEAYIEARNTYDPEQARALLADDFLTDEPPDGFRGLSSLELAFQNHEAWGFHHSLGDCREREQTASPEVAIVDCDSLWTTEVHRRSDYPATPEAFQFRIRDGRIFRVIHGATDYGWYLGRRSFYDDFLSEHLEFRALVDENHNLEPEATREVIERLPEYFELYEEWLNSPEQTPAASPLEGIGAFHSGTHAMSTPREAHTATLLSDGRVLVTGGSTATWESFFDSVETYDHSTGEFTATGSMTESRAQHAATLLADGRVLVTGGWGGWDAERSSAEVYDPASGTFSSAGSMDTARRRHTATLLADGRVLITGGRSSRSTAGGRSTVEQTAEVYDPTSGTFASTGSMEVTRQHHTATLLPDGRVLIAGGWGTSSAEIYDPASGTFSATGSMRGRRGGHSATLLADGRVLLVGGCSVVHENPFVCGDFPDALATAEIYDPASGTFAPTALLASGRHRPTATLLADGRVLVVGGVQGAMGGTAEIWGNTAEIYDPAIGAFAYAAPMEAVRVGHTATLLPDGRVLIAGGESISQSTLESVELFTP